MPEAPAAQLLVWAVLPLWFIAGVADWACHRATAIECTSGTRESALHLLMLAEPGVPLLAALVFEVNALVLAVGLLASWRTRPRRGGTCAWRWARARCTRASRWSTAFSSWCRSPAWHCLRRCTGRRRARSCRAAAHRRGMRAA